MEASERVLPMQGRPPGRGTSRNVYRHRDLDTRVGTLDVAVPKLRPGCRPNPSGCSSRAIRPNGRCRAGRTSADRTASTGGGVTHPGSARASMSGCCAVVRNAALRAVELFAPFPREAHQGGPDVNSGGGGGGGSGGRTACGARGDAVLGY